MNFHPESDRLRSKLRRVLARAGAWEGAIFRYCALAYANRAALLSGAGSRLHGGRWNPPGRFHCIYGSLDPHTALEESLTTSDKYGIPREKTRPRVQVSVSLRLQRTLDLTPANLLRSLGISRDDLHAVDWEAEQRRGNEALTQALGRLAFEERLEAIIVPSARVARGKNLVLFPSRRLKGSSWRIAGARDLPRNG